MMTEPDHTIGYYAVIVPSLDEFQGFYLVDDPILHREAVMMQFKAMMTGGAAHPIGALQAAIVEGFVTGNQQVVAAAALALHGITKHKFYLIEGVSQSGGMVTEGKPMAATTIAEARDELNGNPLVQAIKARLVEKMTKKKKN